MKNKDTEVLEFSDFIRHPFQLHYGLYKYFCIDLKLKCHMYMLTLSITGAKCQPGTWHVRTLSFSSNN